MYCIVYTPFMTCIWALPSCRVQYIPYLILAQLLYQYASVQLIDFTQFSFYREMKYQICNVCWPQSLWQRLREKCNLHSRVYSLSTRFVKKSRDLSHHITSGWNYLIILLRIVLRLWHRLRRLWNLTSLSVLIVIAASPRDGHYQ